MELESSDRTLIRTAIQRYFNAGDTGSSAELRQGLHPGAMMFWVTSDGVLQSRSQSQWCKILDEAASPVRAVRRQIQWIDSNGGVAVASLWSQFSQFQFQDYVLLARLGTGWQIVAKVFQRIEGGSTVVTTDDRRAEILELLARVFRARDSYDADLLGQSCHIRSTRLEVEQGQLVCVALPEWQARWREKWIAGEVNTAAGSIVRLESCGAAAVAELVHDHGDSPLTEYALLLRIEGAWKIMALTCAPPGRLD
jgi:hypothetical protein